MHFAIYWIGRKNFEQKRRNETFSKSRHSKYRLFQIEKKPIQLAGHLFQNFLIKRITPKILQYQEYQNSYYESFATFQSLLSNITISISFCEQLHTSSIGISLRGISLRRISLGGLGAPSVLISSILIRTIKTKKREIFGEKFSAFYE